MIWEKEDIGSLKGKLKIEKDRNYGLSIERKDGKQVIIHKFMDLLIISIFNNNNNNNNNTNAII